MRGARGIAGVFVFAVGVVSSCGRTRTLELVSTPADSRRSVAVCLEQDSRTFEAELLLEVTDGDSKTVLRRDDIARVTTLHAKDELFELGICGAEMAWGSRDVAAIFVKNCLGSTTFVAYDFRERRLERGSGYEDLIRRAIRERYRKELATFDGDPLQWARGPQIDAAYRWRKLGNGRLMGDP